MKALGLVARILIAGIVVLGLAAWWTSRSESPASSAATPPPAETARPVGRQAYDRLLARLAGQPLTAGRLESIARAAARIFESHLDEVAVRLGEQDWHPAFSRLKADHAGDPMAILAAYRREIEDLEDFLRRHRLVPMPASGVEVVEIGNPVFRRYFSLAMYLDNRLAVTLAPPATPGEEADEAGDYLTNHCRICIPPLVAHEVWPGHHVAYQRAEVVPAGPERLAANRDNAGYHEGWALYAEWLVLESGYYQQPERQLGAWRMLYLRALRAWIDPALHLGKLDAAEAEEIYRRQAGMSGEAAHGEVARHLRDPALKASYLIGLVQILELRERVVPDPTQEALLAFHDRLLGAPRPLPDIAREAFGLELDFPEALPGALGESQGP